MLCVFGVWLVFDYLSPILPLFPLSAFSGIPDTTPKKLPGIAEYRRGSTIYLVVNTIPCIKGSSCSLGGSWVQESRIVEKEVPRISTPNIQGIKVKSRSNLRPLIKTS